MCTLESPCGGVIYEDSGFEVETRVNKLSIRRLTCLNGHSFYAHGPTWKPGVLKPPKARYRLCFYCDLPIVGSSQLGNEGEAHAHPACSEKFKASPTRDLCEMCLQPLDSTRGGRRNHAACKPPEGAAASRFFTKRKMGKT